MLARPAGSLTALALLVTPASAAALPDGLYECAMDVGGSGMSVGDIEIKGQSYRGPAFDREFEGSYHFELTSGGVILWGGPLGGFRSDGNSGASTVVTANA